MRVRVAGMRSLRLWFHRIGGLAVQGSISATGMTTIPASAIPVPPDGVTNESAIQTQSIPRAIFCTAESPLARRFHRAASFLNLGLNPTRPGDRPPDCGAEKLPSRKPTWAAKVALWRGQGAGCEPPSGFIPLPEPLRAAAQQGKLASNRTRRNAARDASRACLSAGCALLPIAYNAVD